MEDWANLPNNLLDLIFKKLKASLVDQLQFGATCLSWHSSIKTNTNKHVISSLDHQVPMLLVYNNALSDSWSVYNAIHNKFLLKTQQVQLRECLDFSGSSKGWLAIVRHDYSLILHKFFLSNTNFLAPTIRLPILFPPPRLHRRDSWWRGFHAYHVHKISLSADPLENPNNCTIVAIFDQNCKLAFIRLGRDESWTQIKDSPLRNSFFDDVLYHNGKFYAVHLLGTVVSFDIPESGDPIVSVHYRSINLSDKKYLVTSPRGELWYVVGKRRFVRGHEERKFNIFRIKNVVTVAKINNMGDVALFLGHNSSISVVASNCLGCKANTVYYSQDFDDIEYDIWSSDRTYDFGEYQLETKSSSTITLDCTRKPIWVIPSANHE